MTATGGTWRWLSRLISMRGLVRTILSVQNPIGRYRLTYGIILGVLIWSTYSFITYRVVGNPFVAFMPIVGTISGYLWAILLADELLWLFPTRPLVTRVIRKVKWSTFLLIGCYAVMALGLWVNRISDAPIASVPARIISITTVDLWPMTYRTVTLESIGNTPERQTILGNASDQWDLYPAQEVRLTVRRGILGLRRVLQVHQDVEKHYLRMLQATPDARVALEGLVRLYGDRGDFARAMDWDDTLRARYPDEYETTLSLGKRLTDARRFQDAIAVFRKAAAVSQEYEVLYALGYALAWGGRREEAAQYLLRATELDPTDWRAFYSLGYVYSGLGKLPEAKAAWSKVLQLLPNFPEVEKNLSALNAGTR